MGGGVEVVEEEGMVLKRVCIGTTGKWNCCYVSCGGGMFSRFVCRILNSVRSLS